MDDETRPAMTTLYAGTFFRSVLESRVARALDAFCVPWRYEPFVIGTRHGSYLPDFVLDDKVLLEVKPRARALDQRWRDAAGQMRPWIARDEAVEHYGFVAVAPDGWTVAITPAGRVAGRGEVPRLGRCDRCTRWSCFDETGGWVCARCGHYSEALGTSGCCFDARGIWNPEPAPRGAP